jgi:hypothetical protein
VSVVIVKASVSPRLKVTVAGSGVVARETSCVRANVRTVWPLAIVARKTSAMIASLNASLA